MKIKKQVIHLLLIKLVCLHCENSMKNQHVKAGYSVTSHIKHWKSIEHHIGDST